MTDPVTNLEIEDVLSSIRRLVSEKVRTEAFEEDRAEDRVAVADTQSQERLVLTPALRVMETEDTSHPGAVEADTGFAETEADPEMDAEPVEISEMAFAHRDDQRAEPLSDREVEVVDAGAISEPEEIAVAPPSEEASEDLAEDQPPVILVVEEETQTSDMTDAAEISGVAADTSNAGLEERIAKWEAVVANADEAYEPATAGEDDYAGTEVESLPWQDHSDPVTEHQGNARRFETQEDELADEATFEQAEDLVVEAVAADVSDLFQNISDDAYLDETALRDLVGEIVRQELQGALGERITRNVRKLVRREIHRALSASALD